MQESKDVGASGVYDAAPNDMADREAGPNGARASERDGWQQYRKWISKAPAPHRRRSSIDPSLYTWKGYRNWTEQVKRDWPENQS